MTDLGGLARRSRARLGDPAILVSIGLAALLLAHLVGIPEGLSDRLTRISARTLAELLLVATFLLPGAMASAIRRRAAQREKMREHSRIADVVASLERELEMRVVERTAALDTASDELRAEVFARREAAESLRQSERRYRAIFDESPLPMWVYDEADLRVRDVNLAAIAQYGYSREEFLKLNLVDLRPPEEVEGFLARLLRDPPYRWHAGLSRHQRKDRSLLDVDVYTHRVQFGGEWHRLAVLRDVTETRRLEDQLRQSQKMEAVGLLAGGVAHDFNNLLTTIRGYAEILLGEALAGARREELEEILKASERAASLTQQLLAFSRKQIVEPRVLDLNAVVADMDRMLRRLLGPLIDFRTAADKNLRKVKADRGQLEQVLMNLVVNARDAMPAGGRLTVETRNVELEADYAAGHPEVAPGDYVLLAVSDTGIGMDAATKSRIFEPFFTTKTDGRGTGLGLSTVYGIVKQSGGYIWAYSERDRGSTFKVYLPATGEVLEEQTSPAPLRPGRGSETILLIEDEGAVRSLVLRFLERQGYRVLEAANGDEGVRRALEYAGDINLVLSDAVMPGMDVTRTLERIREQRPAIRSLLMSGYADEAVVRLGILSGETPFLQKPFSSQALLRKVREVLDAE